MSWKIYYDDESVVTSEDITWEQVPSYGVLIIREYPQEGTPQAHMGFDYYLMRQGTIISFSIKDLHDHLLLGIPQGSIKFGRWCPDDVWRRVHDQAFDIR